MLRCLHLVIETALPFSCPRTHFVVPASNFPWPRLYRASGISITTPPMTSFIDFFGAETSAFMPKRKRRSFRLILRYYNANI